MSPEHISSAGSRGEPVLAFSTSRALLSPWLMTTSFWPLVMSSSLLWLWLSWTAIRTLVITVGLPRSFRINSPSQDISLSHICKVPLPYKITYLKVLENRTRACFQVIILWYIKRPKQSNNKTKDVTMKFLVKTSDIYMTVPWGTDMPNNSF